MKPLVSCICPTADRRSFIGTAIKAYLSQDWPEKELVIIDDGQDAIKDLCRDIPNCTYLYVAGPQRIGAKRNLACEAARGEIICHFDDDDWSAAERITAQVRTLWQSRKAVIGYHSLLFWDGDRGYKYKGAEDYSLGSALCYRKDFWRKHPFIAEDQHRFEDNVFVQAARDEQQIIASDGGRMMVARIHAGNTCPKKGPVEYPEQWPPVDVSEIPAEFFKAIGLADSGLIEHSRPYLVGQ